ncbi:MAG TPA: hypothetical protein VF174_15945 [Micromonosporaceae bacterium]
MANFIEGIELRKLLLGNGPVEKSTGTLTHNGTAQLFTVAGGEVLITALWGKCTTTMAGANTVQLQIDPTTGDTVAICQATDLGSTDTAAGTILMFQFDVDDTVNTPDIVKGAGNAYTNLVVPTGEVECVATGSGTVDGVISWYCTWVPLTDGATLVASA